MSACARKADRLLKSIHGNPSPKNANFTKFRPQQRKQNHYSRSQPPVKAQEIRLQVPDTKFDTHSQRGATNFSQHIQWINARKSQPHFHFRTSMGNAFRLAVPLAGFISRRRKWDCVSNSIFEENSPQRLPHETLRLRHSVHIFSEDRLGQIGKERKRERSPHNNYKSIGAKRHDSKADQKDAGAASDKKRSGIITMAPSTSFCV